MNGIIGKKRIVFFMSGIFTYLKSYHLECVRIPEHPKNKCLSQNTPFNRWWHIVFLIIILAMLLSPLINAMNIGVSPASIAFKQVLRQGYSERNIIISSDSLEPLIVDVNPNGEIAKWLNTSVKNFSVSKNGPYSLKVTVTPPLDIPNGNYSGFLRIKTSSYAAPKEGQAVGTIITALDLAIDTEVTDTEVVQCGVSSFNVESVEVGDDVVFNLEVLNSGNVRLRPKIKIDIWDKDQIEIIKSQEFRGNEILPSTSGLVSLRIKSNDLEISQYWVEVSALDCHSSKLLTFDILAEGALKAEGLLLDINVKKSAYVGETIPIIARFQNTGQKEVNAQFKGKISLGNKIVQILESEKVNVPISEVNRFSFYFTPKSSGKYTISGNVFYSGKKTFESSAMIDVISKGINLNSLLITIVYTILSIILLFFIIFLFFMINRQRKKYHDKLRRFK